MGDQQGVRIMQILIWLLEEIYLLGVVFFTSPKVEGEEHLQQQKGSNSLHYSNLT
jgi:hypothetical protein